MAKDFDDAQLIEPLASDTPAFIMKIITLKNINQ